MNDDDFTDYKDSTVKVRNLFFEDPLRDLISTDPTLHLFASDLINVIITRR